VAKNEKHGVATRLNRRNVAAELGVHKSTIRRWEETGLLHPVGDKGETRMFDPAEVKRLRRRLGAKNADSELDDSERRPLADGESDARAFEMFRRGATHEEMVIALRLPSAKVRALFREWQAGYGPLEAEDRDEELPELPSDEASERQMREWEKLMAEALAVQESAHRAGLEARRARTEQRVAGGRDGLGALARFTVPGQSPVYTADRPIIPRP
jgi:DNA-binding transcriptional MerR regulator